MWLSRGKRQVFYLVRRVNGKPRQFRIGTGPLAEKMAVELESRKAERKTKAEASASWKARMNAAENPLDVLCAGLELFITASLLAEGYHRQGRHAWRRRREHREVQA